MKLFYVSCKEKFNPNLSTPLKNDGIYSKYVRTDGFDVYFQEDGEIRSIECKGNAREIFNELKSCDFYVPNNMASIILGESMGIQPIRDLYDVYSYFGESQQYIIEILSDGFTNKDFKYSEDVKRIIEGIESNMDEYIMKDDIFLDRIKNACLRVDKLDADVSEILDTITIPDHIKRCSYLLVENSFYVYYSEALGSLYKKGRIDVFNGILKKCLTLAKTKNDIYFCLRFIALYYKEGKIKKRYCHAKGLTFELKEIEKDEELFKIFKKRLDRYTKLIENTATYLGLNDILWLYEYVDWTILKRHGLIKALCFDDELKILNLNTVTIPEEYGFYIENFSKPYDYATGIVIGFLGICDPERFEELKDAISESVIINYSRRTSSRSCRRFNISFMELHNKQNVITLMNHLIRKLEEKDLVKNKRMFKEFMRDFDVEGIIEHIDFGECREFKKAYTTYMLRKS